MRRSDNLDLKLVVLGSLLAVAIAALELPVPLRLPVGIVAALVLPGYSVSMALFPTGELDAVERSALAFTLSLGAIVLAAPFLNLSPGGLNAHTIVIGLSTITLIGIGIARWRRRGRPDVGHLRGIALPDRLRRRGAGRRWAGAALGLVGMLVVAMLALGVGAPARPATEFFLLGPVGTAEGLLARVTTGTPTTITLGISNHDSSAEPYRIVVDSGSARLAETGPISVKQGDTWSGTVDFSVPGPGNDQEIRILLLQGSGGQPYRSLRLYVDAFAP